jgi:hypothetical protein
MRGVGERRGEKLWRGVCRVSEVALFLLLLLLLLLLVYMYDSYTTGKSRRESGNSTFFFGSYAELSLIYI